MKGLSKRDYYEVNEHGKYIEYLPRVKRFDVEPSSYGNFWDDYRELSAGGDAYYGEVPGAVVPMVARLNLKFVKLAAPQKAEAEVETDGFAVGAEAATTAAGDSSDEAREEAAKGKANPKGPPPAAKDETSADEKGSEAGILGDYAAELSVGDDPEHAGASDGRSAEWASDCAPDEHHARSSTKELLMPFVKAFVLTFQKVVERHLRCQDDDGASFCVVLGSEPKATPDSYTAVQLQFQMPYAHAGAQALTDVIRPNLVKQLCLDNVLAKLPSGPSGGWLEIIDKTVPCPSLPLYGSTRSKDEPVLKYWAVYAPSAQLAAPLPANFGESFDPSNHALFKNGTVPDTFLDGWMDQERLILYLSADYFAKPLQLRKSEAAAGGHEQHAVDGSVADIGDRLDRAANFLKMMKPTRLLYSPSRQVDVAQALYTISKGSEEGLDLLVNHLHDIYGALHLRELRSRPRGGGLADDDDAYEARPCEDQSCAPGIDYRQKLQDDAKISRTEIKQDLAYIYNAGTVPLTERTLAWYAKIDNPEEYSEWHERAKRKALEKAISLSDHDIAQAFYEINWLTIAYCPNNKSWYIYRGHRWRRYIDAETQIVEVVDKYFIQDIANLHKTVAAEMSEARGESQEKSLKLNSGLLNLIARLKKMTPLVSVIRRAKSNFIVENFSDLLDSRGDLLGMKNGVIDLSSGMARFRSGKPEDYISKTTGIDYRVDFNDEHATVKKYNEYLFMVHCNSNIRHFHKLHLASLLGACTEKMLFVLTGEFNNSKSAEMKILRKAMGEYYVDFPTTVVTGKKGSAGAASPELAQAKNTRVAVMAEPDEGENFQGGMLKTLTSGGLDSMFTRKLYQDGCSMEITVHLVIVCNKVPPVPRVDRAVKERVVVVPYQSTFSHDAPDDPEEQFKQKRFKIDKRFERQIPELALAMLWQMVQDYALYRKEGLVIPQEVKERTSLYWSETDIFKSFFAENMEKVAAGEKDSNYTNLKELYTRYREWFTEMCPGMKPVPNQAFKAKANEYLGVCDAHSRWASWRIKLISI